MGWWWGFSIAVHLFSSVQVQLYSKFKFSSATVLTTFSPTTFSSVQFKFTGYMPLSAVTPLPLTCLLMTPPTPNAGRIRAILASTVFVYSRLMNPTLQSIAPNQRKRLQNSKRAVLEMDLTQQQQQQQQQRCDVVCLPQKNNTTRGNPSESISSNHGIARLHIMHVIHVT